MQIKLSSGQVLDMDTLDESANVADLVPDHEMDLHVGSPMTDEEVREALEAEDNDDEPALTGEEHTTREDLTFLGASLGILPGAETEEGKARAERVNVTDDEPSFPNETTEEIETVATVASEASDMTPAVPVKRGPGRPKKVVTDTPAVPVKAKPEPVVVDIPEGYTTGDSDFWATKFGLEKLSAYGLVSSLVSLGKAIKSNAELPQGQKGRARVLFSLSPDTVAFFGK